MADIYVKREALVRILLNLRPYGLTRLQQKTLEEAMRDCRADEWRHLCRLREIFSPEELDLIWAVRWSDQDHFHISRPNPHLSVGPVRLFPVDPENLARVQEACHLLNDCSPLRSRPLVDHPICYRSPDSPQTP